MANEVVSNEMSLIYYGQKAQPNRTNFTPGTVNGRANDMNWPIDFAVPVAGWPAGTDFTFKRTSLVGRGSVSDSAPKAGNILLEESTDKQDWKE